MPDKSKNANDTLALYFLTWQDVVERLDTIILEIRHIQQNIIHLLHTPELYAPLLFEETYLWGHEHWVSPNERRRTNINLIKSWILDYPPISRVSHGSKQYQNRKADKRYIELQKTVRYHVEYELWNVDQKARYINLMALQVVKQNVLNDKFIICKLGIQLFSQIIQNSENSAKKPTLAEFLFTRSAVMARAREYINRLGDLQTNFSHSQDFGLHDHPRPNINRLRDQHMYGVHLNDRCRDINREMILLLSELKVSEYDKHTAVFHSWQKDFTSHSYTFYDNLSEKDKIAHHNINTNFWMPERPDLIPVIAHEVAHGVIHERLGNLDYNTLDNLDCNFATMVKKLTYCVDCYKFDMPSEYEVPIQEIVVDLLAATIEGPAYLYALFLEITGLGLESIIATNKGENNVDLEQIPFISGALGDPQLIRDWYYRISIVCAWLNIVYPEISDTALCSRLTSACLQIINELHKFIEENSPPENKYGPFWETLTDRLCEIIEKESTETVATVKNWLKRRAEQSDNGQLGENHEFLRSSIGLRQNVRDFLVEGLWSKKISRYSEVENDKIKLYEYLTTKQIPDLYKLKSKEEAKKILFRHLHDIPWQSAFLRGLDFVSCENTSQTGTEYFSPTGKASFGENRCSHREAMLHEMHSNITLGRELYQIALDFYVHTQELPSRRLAEAIGVLNRWKTNNDLDEDEKPSSIINEIIKTWIGTPSLEIEDEKEYEDALSLSNNLKNHEEIGDEYTALRIVRLFEFSAKSGCDTRLLGRLAGLKLDSLYKKLKKELGPVPEILRPLINQLAIRSDEEKVGRHNSLITALNCKTPVDNNESLPKYNPPDLHMFSRICYTGSYHNPDHNPEKNSTFCWALIKDYWNDDDIRYQHLIGRYDIASMEPTRPMHRCKLPKFSSDTNAGISYFTRRELVIPVRLGEKDWAEVYKVEHNSEPPYLAMLAITLKRSGSRLDFISRLLNIIKTNHLTRTIKPKYLHQLTEAHLSDTHHDRAYLSDSWADILLVFGNKDIEKNRLEKVFETQSVIFQDFQVDRTELILTPNCFDLAAENLEKFNLSASIRLLEDRSLSGANERFIKTVKRKAENIDISENHTLKECLSITQTPGRMDFNVTINQNHKQELEGWVKTRKVTKRYMDLLLEIYIEKKVNISQNDLSEFERFIKAHALETCVDIDREKKEVHLNSTANLKLQSFLKKNPRSLHQAIVDCIQDKDTDRVQTKIGRYMN